MALPEIRRERVQQLPVSHLQRRYARDEPSGRLEGAKCVDVAPEDVERVGLDVVLVVHEIVPDVQLQSTEPMRREAARSHVAWHGPLCGSPDSLDSA